MLTWLADILRAEDLDVEEVPGWQTRGRDGVLDPRAVMWHHTATPRGAPDSQPLGTVTHGRDDLPGPLCNVLIGRSGKAYVVAAGKANHAGLGGPWRDIPKDSGNGYSVGVEVVNDGLGEPWSETVLGACDQVFAAVLRKIGRDALFLVGHKEYTDRKPDPAGIDMNRYRERLRAYMEESDMDPRYKALLDGLLELEGKDGKPAPPKIAAKRYRDAVARSEREPAPGLPMHEHDLRGKAV